MTTDTALALLAEAEDAICILSDSIRDGTVSEYYSNLRDRITALLDSGGWMPIETAPPLHVDCWIVILGGDFPTIARLNQDFDGRFYWCLENGTKAHDVWLNETTHWKRCERPPLPQGDIK